MPRVFISYRRDDTADAAGRLYQNLTGVIGEANVFKDVDSIPGGAPFSQVIADHIGRADFALVLIGPDWVDITNDAGERRLMRDDDLVRKEVSCALDASATVVPVLVAGAAMPGAESLPDDLQRLAELNAMKLRRDPDFKIDFGRLLGAMGVRRRRSPGQIMAWTAAALALAFTGFMLFQTYFEQPETLPGPVEEDHAETTVENIEGVPIVPYDPEFLGGGHRVPLPRPVGPALDDAFEDGKPVDYLHYSLVMNEQRSLAAFVAINFDRAKQLTVKRANIKWLVDKRLPLAMQREQSLYQKNPWDRGHLVPRLKVTWEDPLVSDPELYQRGVSFFPATVPQHQNFNRTIWLHLERYVQEEIAPSAERLIVFAGPVFRENDAVYRSTRIPRSFWQVAVAVDPDNKSLLRVYAFVANQYRVDASTGNPVVRDDGSPAPLDKVSGSTFSAEDYAISLSSLSALTGLDFGYIEQYDVFAERARPTGLLFDTPRVESKGRELFADARKYAIHISGAKQDPDEFIHLDGFHLESEPPGRINNQRPSEVDEYVLSADTETAVAIEVPISVPGEHPERYRFCWTDITEDRQGCSAWHPWTAPGAMDDTVPRPAKSVREAAKEIIAFDGGFVLISGTPLQAARFAGGIWGAPRAIAGMDPNAVPMSVSKTTGESLILATNAPAGLWTVDPAGSGESSALPLDQAKGLRLSYGSPVSSTPETVVAMTDRRWLKTGGGAGESGLFFWQRGAWGWGQPNLVPYLEDLSFTLTDLKLKAHKDELWGAPTDTTPSSLYRLGSENFKAWEGHDYEIVSCATDLATHPAGIAIVDCDNRLTVIEVDSSGALAVNGILSRLDGWPVSAQTWETQVLASDDGVVAVALNQHTRMTETEDRRTRLFYVKDGRSTELFASNKAHAVSVAVSAPWTGVVFEGVDGSRDTRLFRNP